MVEHVRILPDAAYDPAGGLCTHWQQDNNPMRCQQVGRRADAFDLRCCSRTCARILGPLEWGAGRRSHSRFSPLGDKANASRKAAACIRLPAPASITRRRASV
jgi:hypothetical protein